MTRFERLAWGVSVDRARDLYRIRLFEPALHVISPADLHLLWETFSGTMSATWLEPTPQTMGLFWQWINEP